MKKMTKRQIVKAIKEAAKKKYPYCYVEVGYRMYPDRKERIRADLEHIYGEHDLGERYRLESIDRDEFPTEGLLDCWVYAPYYAGSLKDEEYYDLMENLYVVFDNGRVELCTFNFDEANKLLTKKWEEWGKRYV